MVTPPAILIPAHNEAAVIERCLSALLADAEDTEFEICVVSNGSTDDTADVARQALQNRAWSSVVELPKPSKIEALRTGDEVLHGFPRVYLDADVVLSTEAARDLIAVLAAADAPRVASPHIRIDDRSSPWAVRAYDRVWLQLPYVRKGLIGSGVYAVNEAGWVRKGAFPDVLNDDEYVRSIFGDHERLNSADCFTMCAPRTVGALIRRRARVAVGNADLIDRVPASGRRDTSLGSILSAVSASRVRPWDVGVYLIVTTAAIMLARVRRIVGTSNEWSTDLTSRVDT
ncbi:glycosyltransferase [Gordonia hankookensis]|uniref:4,4'-diaponeurosporenoate glycosyltransferase n=1 Tax=Gordonia hankookensis TaxID=589403 RepID=A0ABR7W890_9ACTN|nr:glycosyltransferase [Gordonia hankookensis]MBD1319039.1 glycosyltransferase [Gordonia hankookensis]